MKKFVLILAVVLAGVVIEGLLALRLWFQMTAEPIDQGLMESLYTFTNDLAMPFQAFTGEAPVKETGLVDYTVLVAVEAYFIIMLGLVVFIYTGGRIGNIIGNRRRPVPDFVARIDPPEPAKLWQPVSTPRMPGKTFYVPMQRESRIPKHAKASLG